MSAGIGCKNLFSLEGILRSKTLDSSHVVNEIICFLKTFNFIGKALSVSDGCAARARGHHREGRRGGESRTGHSWCYGRPGERKPGRASSLFLMHVACAAGRPLTALARACRHGAPARAEQCTSQRADAAACGRLPDVGGEPRVPVRGRAAHRHV